MAYDGVACDGDYLVGMACASTLAHESSYGHDEDGDEVMDEAGVPAEAPHENGAPDVIQVPPNQGQKDPVHRALSRLHRDLVHCGNKPVCTCLKQAHAQDWIVQQAKHFQCDVC